MKLITKLDQIAETAPCSLALGTFDGLHRGHMAVIHAAAAPGPGLEYWEPAVFTFESSPSGVCSVVTPRDKERLLETAGIRRLYSMRFSEVREMEARTFAEEVLFRKCRAKRLCCGEDFRFGRGAAGTFPCCSVSAWKTEWSFSWSLPCWRMEKR